MGVAGGSGGVRRGVGRGGRGGGGSGGVRRGSGWGLAGGELKEGRGVVVCGEQVGWGVVSI